MKKYITEFIGTFFLVLVVGLTGNPVAIGSILMVMIYMGGHISGGHYNPAVSFGVYIRGKLDAKDFGMYFLFQVIGALLAAIIYFVLTSHTFAPAPGLGVPWWKSLLVEFILTFALVSVVLNTATLKKTEGNSYFGLAIGFTVLAGIYAVAPISGGAFNPAVGIGPIIVDSISGSNSLQNIWIYIVGPLLGGAVAAWVFRFVNPGEFSQAQ